MIYLKNSADIAKMRVAGKIVRDTLLLLEEKCVAGITTKELDTIAYKYIISQNAKPSFLGYNDFPASICASINEEVVHGIPGNRVIKDGDIVSLDVGAFIDGFHGDAARTVGVGNVAAEVRQLIDVTKESFFKGVAQFKDGNRLSDISTAIQNYAESFGYGVVRVMVGHGIGHSMHEDPEVPNYYTGRRGILLQEGLALAIEPMINLGTYDVYQHSNGWTVITSDKKPSAHYENTVVLTKDGLEILTI
ncbi:MAG: type I methionyl aminopeptidase [Clostridia bacterium]